MPYVKRRKPTMRTRRRYVRRRLGVRPRLRITRRVKDPVHYFQRFTDVAWKIATFVPATPAWTNTTGTLSQLTIAASTEYNPYLFGFRLGDLPVGTDFTSLFRYYKILGAKITFVFNQNQNDLGILQQLPIVFSSWAPDMDNNDAPTTMQFMRERQNLRRQYVNATKRTISHYIRPKVLGSVVDMNGNTSRSALRTGSWISTNNTSMVHGGILVNFDNTNGTEYVVGIEVKYYLAFKGVQ